MAHAFDHPNAFISEGAPLAAVVGAPPGKPYWKRVGTDSPRWLRQSEARLRVACPRLARRFAREGRRWRERPPLFDRWCGTGQGEMVHAKIHHLPSPSGVAPSTLIPAGRPLGSKGSRRCPPQIPDDLAPPSKYPIYARNLDTQPARMIVLSVLLCVFSGSSWFLVYPSSFTTIWGRSDLQ